MNHKLYASAILAHRLAGRQVDGAFLRELHEAASDRWRNDAGYVADPKIQALISGMGGKLKQEKSMADSLTTHDMPIPEPTAKPKKRQKPKKPMTKDQKLCCMGEQLRKARLDWRKAMP